MDERAPKPAFPASRELVFLKSPAFKHQSVELLVPHRIELALRLTRGDPFLVWGYPMQKSRAGFRGGHRWASREKDEKVRGLRRCQEVVHAEQDAGVYLDCLFGASTTP